MNRKTQRLGKGIESSMKGASLALLAGSSMFCCSFVMASDSNSAVFRQWMVSCENENSCEATAANLHPGTLGKDVNLVVERKFDEKNGWLIALDFSKQGFPKTGSISLSVPNFPSLNLSLRDDFGTIDNETRLYISNSAALDFALPAFLAGKRLVVTINSGESGVTSYELSLLGLTASMLWIEDKLEIVGSPRRAVVPYNLQNTFKSSLTRKQSGGVPKAVRDLHNKASNCSEFSRQELSELGLSKSQLDLRTHLYVVPCSRAAANLEISTGLCNITNLVSVSQNTKLARDLASILVHEHLLHPKPGVNQRVSREYRHSYTGNGITRLSDSLCGLQSHSAGRGRCRTGGFGLKPCCGGV